MGAYAFRSFEIVENPRLLVIIIISSQIGTTATRPRHISTDESFPESDTEGGRMATHVHLPVIPVKPSEKHAQPIVDYSVEANVLQHVRANRWLALDIGRFRVARFNWVVFALASIILWAFVIGVMASGKQDADGTKSNAALTEFAIWQKWITQNFTWLYIATQVCFVCLLRFAPATPRYVQQPYAAAVKYAHF